jgi:hypothetical protein
MNVPELTPEALRVMYEGIRQNRTTLDNCPKHRFSCEQVTITLGVKLRCLECGGDMILTEIAQYIRGYVAAGGDANEIWPGYWT